MTNKNNDFTISKRNKYLYISNVFDKILKYFYYLLSKIKNNKGPMPEWLMGADCKSAGYTYVGSNPTRPKIKINKENSFSFK